MAREKGEAVVLLNDRVTSSDDSKRGSTTMVVWSRKCENLQLSPTRAPTARNSNTSSCCETPSSPDMALTGSYLVGASVNDLTGEKAVNFTFNARGGQIFGETHSRELAQGRIAERTLLVPGDHSRRASRFGAVAEHGHHDSGQIKMGSADPEDLRRLAQILRSGALPATLKPEPVSENTIGATLGPDTIRKGTLSVGIAFAAVLVFMLFYYRFAGMVACIALLANLLLTVAFMVFVNATFTLPGLAGLVLMLGMAVDANVLIYERLREERDAAPSLPGPPQRLRPRLPDDHRHPPDQHLHRHRALRRRQRSAQGLRHQPVRSA